MSIDENKFYYAGAKFSDVWKRITKETDIKYLSDLGKIVGVTQQNVSIRKKENLFPFGWAYIVAREKGLLTEWIVTGNGPKRSSDTGNVKEYDFKVLDDLNDWLNELVVGEPHRKDWFLASIEDSFPMFREWKKRREQEEGINNSDSTYKIA